MKKTALIYSFNTKMSSTIAKKIGEEFGGDLEIINAEEINGKKFTSYKNLIISVPTWYDGELPNYWDEFVPELEDLDLKQMKFAIFGLGDQKGYPENFVDAIGIMATILEKQGAEIIGQTSTEGYTFESSRAVRNGKFLGLAIDQETQAKKTRERIKSWVEQIKEEFK